MIRTLLALCPTLLLCASLSAGSSVTINSFTLNDFTGDLIASDALIGSTGYDRDALHLSAVVSYSASPTNSFDFELQFSLIDASGNPVQVYNASNTPDTAYRITQSFGALGAGVGNFYNVDLKPVNQLDHLSSYTPRLEIYETGVGGLPTVPTLKDNQDESTQTIHHFTSTNASDSALNVLVDVDGAWPGQASMLAGGTFTASLHYNLRRYDRFYDTANPAAADNVKLRANMTLKDSLGNTVPLASSSQTFTVNMARHNYNSGSSPAHTPAQQSFSKTLNFAPSNPASLSFGENYALTVELTHEEVPGSNSFSSDETATTMAVPLLFLSGNLYFGSILTTVTSVTYVQMPGTPSGSNLVTLLTVGINGGNLGANHFFGNGTTPIQVEIHPNGDAYYTGNAPGATSMPVLSTNDPDQGSLNGITFTRQNLTLGTSGLNGTLILCLPTGLGYQDDPALKLLQHELAYPSPIAFNSSLQPTATSFSFNLVTPQWFVEESKPILFQIQSVQWDVTAGDMSLTPTGVTDLRYARLDELNYLESVVGLNNSMGSLKRSNELYYRYVETLTSGTISIETDAAGSARLTAGIDLETPASGSSHTIHTHFPYDAIVDWEGPGHVDILDDHLDPASSSLTSVNDISLSYDRDCGQDCGNIAAATVNLSPDGGEMTLTGDGGMLRAGTMPATDLTWGYISTMSVYAQQAMDFTEGVFMASGHFQTGETLTVPNDRGAGSILLSGAFDDGSYGERPGSAAYSDGDAEYPGFNFHVPNDGDHDGNSVLAGNTAIPDYPLSDGSKYYIRKGGVSGVQQAVTGTFTPPDIYGFNMTFDEYGLSYLDSRQVDGITFGNLEVPYPSAFNLAFSDIRVNCLGAVEGADIGGNGDKILAYWNGDFTPLSMEFARNANQMCDPTAGTLALGAAGHASHITPRFYGTLGFKSDGNLVTAADNLVDGMDSRLGGPTRVKFEGPEGETYRLDLATELYYNNYDEAGGAEGFVNLAGKLDVPFFEDVKVHLHTRGDRDSTIAPLKLMGGWPDHGFGGSSNNFFTTTTFDNDHVGYAGADVATYHNSGSEDYLPRAQQNWLGIVNFDYPMVWSDFDRSFTSYGEHKNRFLIVDVEHDLPYLSARQAEMTFGASWDGVPQLSLANLATNLVDDQVMRPFRAAVDEGKDALSDMLSDQVQELFDPVLDELLDPLLEELYQELKNAYENNVTGPTNEMLDFSDWIADYNQVVNCQIKGTAPGCADESLQGILENVIGHVDDVNGLLKEIDEYLEKTELVLDAFTSSFKDPEGRILSDTQGMFVCDPSGNIDVAFAEELIKRLLTAEDLGVDPAIIGQAIDSLLAPLLEDAKPTLKKVAEKLLKLKKFITQVREYLGTASEFVTNLHDQLLLLNSEITNVVNTVDGAVQGFFTELENMSTLVGSPFEEFTEQELKDFIKTEIKDAFYSSEVGTKLQVIIKQQLFDTNGAICQGIDSAFASLNKIIRDLLTTALQDLDNKIIPFLDKLNSVIGAGKLTGYAHIVDDAIRYARMDAHLEWSIPEKMDFDGYIEIKQLNAEGSENACYANSPGVINEVTLGANHVPLNWISEGVKADIWGKATFDTTSGVKLLGVGGGFEMVEGEIKFEKFRITELGAAIAFGEKEAYLGAKAHAVFESVEAGIGAFFGKTCTIEPLAMVDADVASILGSAPFTGAYLYGEAWIPVLDYGCPLRISAGAGIGLGYFAEGPTWIGKMKLGVSGEAICVVSVRGELMLIGVKQGSDFRFKGRGTISGSVGKCKWFCIKFKKSITVEK